MNATLQHMTKPDHPGKLGVWAHTDCFSASQLSDFANQLQDWGYSALWIPEAIGRDPFVTLGFLASETDRLILATGIANIYARDPMAMKAIRKTLSELLPGRFILGLGVSHPHLVSHLRGHEWEKPVPKMRGYLDALDQAFYQGAEPEFEAPIVLAALRPLMLRLAADRTQGAHPYLVTPAHTRRAREIMGKGPWLCPEQMVMLETDAVKARKAARQNLAVYLRAPNYQNSLLEIGFTPEDFTAGGSDRLVDELVPWGSEEQLRARIQEHWDAGADHVCVQALRSDGEPGPDMDALALLAPEAKVHSKAAE